MRLFRRRTMPSSYKAEWFGAWPEYKIREFQRANGLKPVIIHEGDPVRIVDMRGCMATERHVLAEGTVQRVFYHTYPQGLSDWVAEVLLDDGTVTIYPASSAQWIYGEDGIAERRQ